MTIRARLVLLLGALLLVFLGTLEVLHQTQRTQAERLTQDALSASRQVVQRWINLVDEPVQRFARDYSQWSELADFVSKPDPTWAETNLHQALKQYEAHAVWVLNVQGQLVYSANTNDGPPLTVPLATTDPGVLASLRNPRPFFAESRDGLLEIWVLPVPTDATDVAPRGWLLVARLWGPRHIALLERLSEAQLQLVPAGGTPAPGDTATETWLPLPNFTGSVQRQLVVRISPPDFMASVADDLRSSRWLVLFALLVLVAMWIGIAQWVLRPLRAITTSLIPGGDPALLRRLAQEKTELGHVAQLLDISLAQKAALQHEVEERGRAEAALHANEQKLWQSMAFNSRLARDLHDGVIQSIYAAGLGLESAMGEMAENAPAARTRFQQCRQSLNDVIREVRSFINGLEPESTTSRSLAQEMETLVQTMQALWPGRITLEVDASLSRALDAAQEMHALQIVRESLGNAIRHGAAKSVRIKLAPGPGGACLSIHDDGQGFDPQRVDDNGRGLKNLASRAQEMGGSLRIDSQRGTGTTITVHFTLAAPSA